MQKKMLALLAALVLALSATPAYAEQPAEDPVMATFNGENILKSEVDKVIPQLSGYMSDATDYRNAAEFVVQQRILQKKIEEMGFNTFTAEEESAFAAEAEKQWNEGIDSYVSYYLAEDTEEARAQLKTQAEAFYAQQGLTRESLIDNIRKSAAVDRMSSYLVGDYEPTEEEIQGVFQQFGASYQKNYENNVAAYEYNTYYYQQPSWYTPEGYRGIIHILIKPDAEKLENYSTLMSRYEEQQSAAGGETAAPQEPEATAEAAAEAAEATAAPTATPEPVTPEQIEQARQAVMDSVKTQVDDIYARLAKGESFESLIAMYGEDPGMKDEKTLSEGYNVHKDSVVWDPVFTKAAFSDKMVKAGDVSDPVIGSYGVHILKYLRDVPSGLIMTDSIHSEIVDYLKAVKNNSAMTGAIADWTKDYTITYNEESIKAATEAARAKEPDDEGVQAVPADGEAVEEPAVTEAPN